MANTNLNKSVGGLLTAANVNDQLAVDSAGNWGIGTENPSDFFEIVANKDSTTAGSNPIVTIENSRTSSGTSAAELLFRSYETDSTSHNRALLRASARADINDNSGIFELFTANSGGTITKALDVNELQLLSLPNTPIGETTPKNYAMRVNEGYALATGRYKNLTSSRPSTTTVDIDADHLILEDSTNQTFLKVESVNVTINSATSGANGLDTGSYAATWYYNWIIAKNDGTVAGLHSTSATSPTMPTDYTHKKLIGAVYCSSIGPVVFSDFQQINDYINPLYSGSPVFSGTYTNQTVTADFSSVYPDITHRAVCNIRYAINNQNSEIHYSTDNSFFSKLLDFEDGSNRSITCQVIVQVTDPALMYFKFNAAITASAYHVGYFIQL